MFGHDNNDNNNNDNQNLTQPSAPPVSDNNLLGTDDNASTTTLDATQPPLQTTNPPMSVTDFNTASPTNDTTISSPTTTTNDNSTSSTPTNNQIEQPDDTLLSIKREALEELSPLINHLEQDAEEKFRTTMMMIQASDNKELIPQAFTAAKEIKEDKKRAQALLDIVNEINYFTHKES